jgi:hypothetical protein
MKPVWYSTVSVYHSEIMSTVIKTVLAGTVSEQVRCDRWQVRCVSKSPAVWTMLHPIRARQTILEGEEVTLPYKLGNTTYIERDKDLRAIIEMQCDCPLCTSDHADGDSTCRKRRSLVEERWAAKEDLQKSTGSAMSSWALAQDHVQKLLATYHSTQSVPHPILCFAYFDLMQVTERDGQRQLARGGKSNLIRKSIQIDMEVFKAIGFTEIDTTMEGRHSEWCKFPLSKNCLATAVHSDIYSVTMVHMAASFLSLQESICAERWFRAAWWGKRSCVPKYHFLTNPVHSSWSHIWWRRGLV